MRETKAQRKACLWKGYTVTHRTAGIGTSPDNFQTIMYQFLDQDKWNCWCSGLHGYLFFCVFHCVTLTLTIHSKLNTLRPEPKGFSLFYNFQFIWSITLLIRAEAQKETSFNSRKKIMKLIVQFGVLKKVNKLISIKSCLLLGYTKSELWRSL